jgi:hypothetical protein
MKTLQEEQMKVLSNLPPEKLEQLQKLQSVFSDMEKEGE